MTANSRTLFAIDAAEILWFYWCLHLAGNYVATTWRAVGSLLHLDKANPLHGVLFLSADVILEGSQATPCCAATLGARSLVGRRRHGSFLFYSCSARIVKLNSTFFASRCRCLGRGTFNPLLLCLKITFVVSESALSEGHASGVQRVQVFVKICQFWFQFDFGAVLLNCPSSMLLNRVMSENICCCEKN